MIYAIIIVYCAITFGIHGGELVSGINRQVRNALCATPFAVVAYFTWDYPEAVAAFTLAFVGVNMGFDNWPLWFKGFITLPIGGFVTLPLAYWIGNKTKYTNVLAEYLSGTFYGLLLAMLWSIR